MTGTPPGHHASDFLLQLAEQLGVALRVHFAAENFLRAGDRERGDLLPQHFPGAGDLLVDIGLGRGEDALSLRFRRGLRLVPHLRLALFRRADALADALARLRELFVHALARLLQLPPALLARRDSVCDDLPPLVDLSHPPLPAAL